LALIGGKPMLQHVWERAKQCRHLDEVVIATDDRRIQTAARAFRARVSMTPKTCPSGTDRIALAAKGLKAGLIVNIQGDEPFLHPPDVDRLVLAMRRRPVVDMGTLAAALDPAKLEQPSCVKVICDRERLAIYFSRAVIPYPRNPQPLASVVRQHLGIYAYRPGLLRAWLRWQPTPLERAEGLEQLRALEHGKKILVVDGALPTQAVDTPADLEEANRIYRAMTHKETNHAKRQA
jgi:3-deoxy-manno-octulosonate cytidylyltransferase (CMP-KDO synthetase)